MPLGRTVPLAERRTGEDGQGLPLSSWIFSFSLPDFAAKSGPQRNIA